MLTARSVFREIIGDDKTFQLFASIAAVGEAQGGWENAEIASRLPDSLRQLKPKVIRHGAVSSDRRNTSNCLPLWGKRRASGSRC